MQFNLDIYRKTFGRLRGVSLFYSFSQILKQLPQITSEEIKTKISIIIWKDFGIEWLKYFKCNQDPLQVTPHQGEFCFSHLLYRNVCLNSLCPPEHVLVLGDEYTVRVGFTPKVEGV